MSKHTLWLNWRSGEYVSPDSLGARRWRCSDVRLPQPENSPSACSHVVVLRVIQGCSPEYPRLLACALAVMPVVTVKLNDYEYGRIGGIYYELVGEGVLPHVRYPEPVQEGVTRLLQAIRVSVCLFGVHIEQGGTSHRVSVSARKRAVESVRQRGGYPKRPPTDSTLTRHLVPSLPFVVTGGGTEASSKPRWRRSEDLSALLASEVGLPSPCNGGAITRAPALRAGLKTGLDLLATLLAGKRFPAGDAFAFHGAVDRCAHPCFANVEGRPTHRAGLGEASPALRARLLRLVPTRLGAVVNGLDFAWLAVSCCTTDGTGDDHEGL